MFGEDVKEKDLESKWLEIIYFGDQRVRIQGCRKESKMLQWFCVFFDYRNVGVISVLRRQLSEWDKGYI